MNESIEKRAIARISWRLLPLVILIYFIAYIDRTNVGFAALTMNRELGLSSYIYGWGAGIFFIGYFLFEIPSNLILDKVGARTWIARIMVTWGVAAAAMAFVSGPISFLALRFFLGMAEAGLFPGLILYFTYWYPAAYRGRVISAFYLAAPASNAAAATISGLFLQMDGLCGIAGWKWMFVLEALPAILVGLVVLRYLTENPTAATWLPAEEKLWLAEQLRTERAAIAERQPRTMLRALADRRVMSLALIYFALNCSSYGITFFLPQIVKQLGLSSLRTGFVTAIPYLAGTLGMLLWGWSSDRHRERRWHLIMAALVAAFGLAVAGSLPGTWTVAAISIAAVGLYATKPPFWPLPSLFLTGRSAAAGIAMINAIGNLGGFFGPYMVGWVKDSTNSFTMALYGLAACALAAAGVAFLTVNPVHPAVPSSAP